MPNISPINPVHTDIQPQKTNTLRTNRVTPELLNMLDTQCASMEKRVRRIMYGRIATSLFGTLLFAGLFGAFIYNAIYGRQQNIGFAISLCVVAIPFVGSMVALLVANSMNSFRLKYWYRSWNRMAYIRERSHKDPLMSAGFAMRSVEQATAALNPAAGLGANSSSRAKLLVGAWMSADHAGLIQHASDNRGEFIDEYFELRAKRDAFAAMLSVQRNG